MFAIGTSMPRTAPALAGFAGGTRPSTIDACVLVGAASHGWNLLDRKHFHGRRYNPTTGSAGARVM
jgi:hypothetical protein